MAQTVQKIIMLYNKKHKVRGLESFTTTTQYYDGDPTSFLLLCHPSMPIMSAHFVLTVARWLQELWAIHLNLKMSCGREIYLRNL